MSEELQEGQVEAGQEAVENIEEQGAGQTEVTPSVSKYDAEARTQGWVPKEEWDGDPDDWTDSREFVKRGELFHKISNQSGELKELRKAMQGLVEHHNKVKDTEFKRALDYLKTEKKKALEDGNADQLIAVDDAIEQLKDEQSKAKTTSTQQEAKGPTPVFVDWVKQNAWYASDQDMRAFADDIGVGYYNRNPGVSEGDLYKVVKERVMKAFPEKFKGQGTKNQSVEGTSNAAPKKSSTFKLTEEEERVCKTFVRTGALTREQYIADIKSMRGES